MDNVNINNLRGTDFEVYKGKQVTIEGFVSFKDNVGIAIDKIVFECPECSTNITVAQEYDDFQKPKMCTCGRRGNFLVIDKQLRDIGTLYITDPFMERPKKIQIITTGNVVSPESWNKIKIGTKICVEGKLDFDIQKRIMTFSIMTDKIDVLGELSFNEKINIVYKHVNDNFSVNLDKGFYKEMSQRCIVTSDVIEIVETLCKEGRIYLPDRKEIAVITKLDSLAEQISKENTSDCREIILEIITSLEESIADKSIPVWEIFREASKKGIQYNTTATTLDKLSLEGTIFLPKDGFIRKV